MKILLDECTPRVLKRRLRSHDVHTAQDRGWTGVKNGELLDNAEREGFEVFITSDQRLRHQQNLSKRRLAVLVLPSNQVPVVVKLLADIETALAKLSHGTLIELQLSS